jgi:acyl-CoA synthetase (AMP-forming)/AMP-acid ligase II
VRVIRILEEPIAQWSDGLELPQGNIGEIVVRSAVVTGEYLNRPQQTAEVKIQDDEGFWHRMGDIGYLDEKGRLWFCGRKSHRVETDDALMLPIPCETLFNAHPRVDRCALVGVGPRGGQEPVLVVESQPGQGPRSTGDAAALADELRALARAHEHTRAIHTVLFHGPFPMDVRHNAKIQREKLAAWAEETLS